MCSAWKNGIKYVILDMLYCLSAERKLIDGAHVTFLKTKVFIK
ncbi:hypothetical protein B4064_3383 [Caldibacillus thermoamylovorans]|nr:hypothetical protein B4064_3383 [Caldibacillus thermoamylovorans]